MLKIERIRDFIHEHVRNVPAGNGAEALAGLHGDQIDEVDAEVHSVVDETKI